jgi:hypothetical protein
MPGLETGHISTTREKEIVCMLEKDFSGERRIYPKCFSLHQVADFGDGFDPGTSNSSATLNWLKSFATQTCQSNPLAHWDCRAVAALHFD